LLALSEKTEQSIEIIKAAVESFSSESIGVLFTGGKSSTVTLHLIRQIFGGYVPFKVIWIDTSVYFPEHTAFVEKLKKIWQLKFFTFKNETALREIQLAHNKDLCCRLLKTEPLMMAVRELGIKALITDGRLDEDHVRHDETVFSESASPSHIRVEPIKNFREEDIRDYIENYHVPYCSLYQKGYQLLDCMPCSESSQHMSVDKSPTTTEDREDIMRNLRSLGYL
jgi:phosphoadenosine phosphosulfate reductase